MKYKIYLKALTMEAELSLRNRIFRIPKLPFRVGRESRKQNTSSTYPHDRRNSRNPKNNDLYIVERGKHHNISREHFLIEERGDGFYLVDRRSTCGTIVEGNYTGGGRIGGEVPLSDGDVIIVGTAQSEYIYKFVIE